MRTSAIPYRVVSLAVCISILFSLFPIAGFSGDPYAYAEADDAAHYQPAAPALEIPTNPVSIGRIQTSYTEGTTAIEFTITNNLPPTRLPDVPDGTAITDTISIFASFVISDDVNTLRNLIVQDTLTNGTALLTASGEPTINGDTLTWTLPDLPPQGTLVFTMSVQTPPSSGDFLELDTGAQVYAEQWGSPIAVEARPALIIPTGIDPAFTFPTVDADTTDADMLLVSTEFTQDPLAAFTYVREFGYDPYKGSLRGTRGTLWGQAGNSADQSSLLIAMLRAAGVPARYRHGTLSTATAQTLIESMFPAPVGVAGSLPVGTAVSDPINDPALIDLISDHWWVEAYLPGQGWTNLDPSFPGAQPGDIFATPGDNDRIPEFPDNQRHEIAIRLKVEQYNTFPIGGSNLQSIYPLEVSFPSAQLASKRLTFAHLVSSQGLGGAPFTTITHTYTPYFAIEDNDIIFLGDPFQDLFSNFAFSSKFTTAEWLEYEITDPDGNVETFTRTVKDLIGPDTRMVGGPLSLSAGSDSLPFARLDDVYVNWVLPNEVPTWVYQRQKMSVLPQVVELGSYGEALLQIDASTPPGEPLSPEDSHTLGQARGDAYFANESLLTGIGLDFGWKADRAMAQIEQGFRTKLYYASPRVFTVASVGDPTDVVTQTVDLRRTTANSIVYPGQAVSAAYSANWAKGLVEADLEGQVLEDIYETPPLTTARIFDEMEIQDITPVWIAPSDAYLLDIYPFSPEAKALVLTALNQGKSVLIPTAPVSVDGQDVFGWWQVDPQTGETIGVTDNGLHGSAAPYILLEGLIIFGIEQKTSLSPGDVISFATVIGQNMKAHFENLVAEWEAATGEMMSLQLSTSAVGEWRYFPAHLCPVDNCGLEQFFLNSIPSAPIPLPDAHFVYADAYKAHHIARSSVHATPSQPPGDPAFTLTAKPSSSSTTPDSPINFQAEISSNFEDDFNMMVYAPEDWNVRLDATGDIVAQPPAGAQTGDYPLQIVAQSSLYVELFDTVQHIVTINALDVVSVNLDFEPDITVPMGAQQIAAVSNQTNDGEAEIAGAAYIAVVANPGQSAHTYDMTVSGPPAGWVWLNGEQTTASSVTLPAGATARLGLYIQPPPDTLPTPGTNYPLDVTAIASDNPALTDSAAASFNMPNQAFNYITTQPAKIYLSPNSSTDFTIQMTNIGNGSASFPITATLPPITATVFNLQSPISLSVGETHAQTATLETTGIPLGWRFPLLFKSPAPGSYTQYSLADVQIVSENSAAIFYASERAGSACTLGEPGFSAALESLALAMVHLEASCERADCDLSLRDLVVDAAYSAALYAGKASALVTQDGPLSALADTLATHTANADILADLTALSTSVSVLDSEICALSRHLPALRWTPFYGAALPNETVTYTLDLMNTGTFTTTHNLTVTLPSSVVSAQWTVAPGDTASFDYPVSMSVLGLYPLDATAVVEGEDAIYANAAASLNVVDRYVQLTAVTPDPAFVETGISSTILSIEVANTANVALDTNARTVIQAPTGALSYTADLPLRVLIGAPRVYELQTVDTSGWVAGLYTVTVELLDEQDALIPDGSGYGYFSVGQSLAVSHAISPTMALPGVVTVTTLITTGLTVEPDETTPLTIVPTEISLPVAEHDFTSEPELDAVTPIPRENQAVQPQQSSLPGEASFNLVPTGLDLAPSLDATASITISDVFTRTEQNEPEFTYTGSWYTYNYNRASGNSYARADAPGETATFSFYGDWVNVGFLGTAYSGQAEIFIDGASQGVLDLYRRDTTAISFVYDDLITATHTISIAAQGTSNPYALNDYVQLDYIDAWDSSPLADGTYEEDDSRVLLSAGWVNYDDSVASGGSYIADDLGTAWFPFTGDSFSFHTILRSANGYTHLYVDGQYLTSLHAYSRTTLTKTLSYQGFGPGPHILQVSTYRATSAVDAFSTPGVAPFDEPDPVGNYHRYEEDHPAWLYNGVPYTQTATTWTRTESGVADRSSGDQVIASSTAASTAQITVTGSWLNLGFGADNTFGQAEIFLDGVSQGTIDLYRRERGVVSKVFAGLANTTHTISMTVSGGGNIWVDYLDVWGGTDLITGTFREYPQDGYYRSGGWGYATWPANFWYTSYGTAWFPFTGDSVTYTPLMYNNGGRVKLYIDEEYQGIFKLYSDTAITDTISFDGLGEGAHVLRVESYRAGNATLDAFVTPGVSPFYTPTVQTGIIRYEEDDSLWLYNGVPYIQTDTSWTRSNTSLADRSSDDQIIGSGTADDTAQITVTGEWINLGFATNSSGGQAEIFLDGISQGIFDLYRHDNSVISEFFTGLANTTHTISVTVIGDGDVWIDYIDVWDGTAEPNGTFYHPEDGFYFSAGWGYSTYPQNHYYSSYGNAWFPFTGDSVSFIYLANTNGGDVRIYLDDQYQGVFSVYNSTAVTKTLSFDGLGAGAHTLRLETYRVRSLLNAFKTPGDAPFYTPPSRTGIIRYEEDDPVLRYNGLPYTQTVTTWNISNNPGYGSEGYYAGSGTSGDTVNLTFEGAWFGVGFLTHSYGGHADIYLDGTWLKTVDLFSNQPDTTSYYFDNLVDTTHTVSVTVLGTAHPNSLGQSVRFDYFDAWDGSSLPDGTFEENDERVIISEGWSTWASGAASGGSINASNSGTAWFPFTGQSITYQALASFNAHEVIVKIDGVTQGLADIYNYEAITRTISLTGLMDGPHVMEVRSYRQYTTVDAFITPGSVPWYETPASPTGITRYEEDDPALLYNGYPFTKTVTTWWLRQYAYQVSSNAVIAGTNESGNWVSLDFSGTWVGVGFSASNGEAEIFIDGISRDIVDLSLEPDVTNIYYDDLITGTHTISVARVSGYVYFDYFDTWDGTDMGDGWYEAKLSDHTGPYHYNTLSNWYTRYPDYNLPRIVYARDSDVIGRRFPPGYPTHVWFTFTGDDLLFLPFQNGGSTMEVFIDGISQGVFDLTPGYSTQPYAIHFQDLGEGPHVARVNSGGFIDAFQVNPPNALPYTPQVEWHDDAPTLMTTIAIGDLEGDGIVELVAPGHDGTTYVYRGDGADAGGGTPLLWSTTLVGRAAEPALADLDQDGDAEIVISGENGTYAFQHDGSTYWYTDSIKGYDGTYGWGGPSIGNLDLEPGPEIVIAASGDALYVLDHDGDVLFETPIDSRPVVPVLADLTGDGILDILYAQGQTITLLDYYNGANIEWTRTHTYTGAYLGAFGAPAVADVDGKQPGGDDGPEVIINWGPTVEVLDEDGTPLWNYRLEYDYYAPSPITVADVDGDNEIEILTASAYHVGFWVDHHRLYVLNADGTLLWHQNMGDTSSSASGVATQDLNGDGVWEVLWNGQHEGFTIMNGPDGTKLFNEEFTESGTILDYPTLGDVDGDGYAEVVVGGSNGIFVIGHDGIWDDSRPVWNQHNYHIINVNDNLSIPVNEPNSWDVHNTYRTQTPERSPMPGSAVVISHTVGVQGVTVLTNTFNVSPTVLLDPLYGWNYTVDSTSPVVTRTFESVLSGLQPGESRLVAQGTEVAYTLPGGLNWLTLPPLYLNVPHIIAIEPISQTAGAGITVVYTVTLTNYGAIASEYSLSLGGLPAGWSVLSETVNVPASGEINVPLTVALPGDADPAAYPFNVLVETQSGGSDQAGAFLESLGPLLEVTIAPSTQTIATGETAEYDLTITNLEAQARTYALNAEGFAGVSLPAQISVAANSTEMNVISAQAVSEGTNPFTVIATELATGASAQDTAVITGQGFEQVVVTIFPEVAQSGPGVPTVFAVMVTNLGTVSETYDLAINPPAGWDAALTLFGQQISSVLVAPGETNALELQLMLTPPVDAVQGDYGFSVTADSQTLQLTAPHTPLATAAGSGTVQVGAWGVQIEITSGDVVLSPTESGIWQVQVTNTGDTSDSYDLSVFGPMGAFAGISPSSVSLAPGQSQTVQVSAGPLGHALPGDLSLGVLAESQTQSHIQDEDAWKVTILEYQAVEVTWQPGEQTIEDILSAGFTLLITNTGNVNSTYQFAAWSDPAADIRLATTSLPIPPRSTASLLVDVTVPGAGVYILEGQAQNGALQASDTAALTVTVQGGNLDPLVEAGPDQTAAEGDLVQFQGTASDPNIRLPSEIVSLQWDFGDGYTTTGTLTPTHIYIDDGVYTVTLFVTDTHGGAASDWLLLTIENVSPALSAFPNQPGFVGEAITVTGTITDPGMLDSQTVAINWEEGVTETLQLDAVAPQFTAAHTYTAAGEYSVLVTVTDKDGGWDQQEFMSAISDQGHWIYLPLSMR